MGIAAVFDSLLEELSRQIGFSGRIGTLGVMDIDGKRDPRAYFGALGYSTVESIDVSDDEGADRIFDLNEPTLPEDLRGRYDGIFNGGTLEHVFNVPNALASITNMLKPGGIVFHIVPCNGWVNHGFYQFSPVFMFDYYAAARFDVVCSMLCSFDLAKPDHWAARSLRRDDLAEGNAGTIADGRVYLYFFVARRSHNAIERPCPTQGLYSNGAARSLRMPFFVPYEVRGGVKTDAAVRTRRRLTQFKRETGFCWTSPLPDLSDVADGRGGAASGSPLILLEDGQSLGPARSSHSEIRAVGAGRFSHWTDDLYFSTSDNSDPETNDRVYEILLVS